MGITLSHLSALDAIRTLRCEGHNLKEMTPIGLAEPAPWVGKRWSMREFRSPEWKWAVPSEKRPLDVLVSKKSSQVRMRHVNQHSVWQKLPPHSILWLDEHSSMVAPEFAFLQAATYLSLPMLVLLGYELCGNFSRLVDDPLEGKVVTQIPAATSVEEIKTFLESFTHIQGLTLAKEAIAYVSDHALSAPEAVLATMYSLPVQEDGYGMGPVTLNEHIRVEKSSDEHTGHSRYPDLLFPFAPMGINYDGEDHLDLKGIVRATQQVERADGDERGNAVLELENKLAAVRGKVVDDNTRNRQLMSRGYLVLPATKENLYGFGNLDEFTRQLLQCANHFCGINISKYEKALNDTDKTRDRYSLLASMLPSGAPWGSSHGTM